MIQPDILRISRVQSNDVTRLRQISTSTFLETFGDSNTAEDMEQYLAEHLSEARLLQELETAGSEFYFAWLDGEIVGYLKLNEGAAQTEQHIPDALEIERIYVAAAFQGKRTGSALIHLAADIARKKQHHVIWLGVWEHNQKAIPFYEQFGFRAFDRHTFRLGNDEQTDIMMKVTLDEVFAGLSGKVPDYRHAV